MLLASDNLLIKIELVVLKRSKKEHSYALL